MKDSLSDADAELLLARCRGRVGFEQRVFATDQADMAELAAGCDALLSERRRYREALSAPSVALVDDVALAMMVVARRIRERTHAEPTADVEYARAAIAALRAHIDATSPCECPPNAHAYERGDANRKMAYCTNCGGHCLRYNSHAATPEAHIERGEQTE